MQDGAGEDRESKTETATERKRTNAIEDGNIPVVRDTSVVSAALTLVVFCALALPWTIHTFAPALIVILEQADEIGLRSGADVSALLHYAALIFLRAAGPFILLSCVIGLALSFLQNPPRFYPRKLQPSLGNMSIQKGLRRMLGPAALAEFGRSFFKICLMSAVVWFVARSLIYDVLGTAQMDPGWLPLVALGVVQSAMQSLAIVLVAFHIGEMLLARFRWLRELRMSRQELRDEFKQTEGNPIVRSRLRSLAQSRVRRRMIAAVPEATVVIANPTHFAVALRYRRDEGGAPLVVAKGADHLALKIRSTAEEHRVPVIENKPLAQNLYHQVDVDKMIPARFYRAIAEIIIMINEARRKGPYM